MKETKIHTNKFHKNQKIIPRIPEELVYEIIDGKPVYYHGYKQVINLEKSINEIMGSSDIQQLLVSVLLKFLFTKLSSKKYFISTNEGGLHINKNNNISGDIMIFEKEDILKRKITGKYIDIPPKIIIEIDTKADLSNFDNIMDYYQVKTKKLFQFGVDKVFWILTKNKQIIEAVPNEDWLVKTWDREINLFENVKFTIDSLLKEEDVYELVYEND